MGPISEFRKQRKEEDCGVYSSSSGKYRLPKWGRHPAQGQRVSLSLSRVGSTISDSGGWRGENIPDRQEWLQTFADGCWAQPSVLVMNYKTPKLTAIDERPKSHKTDWKHLGMDVQMR